jgi:hypothetical protein
MKNKKKESNPYITLAIGAIILIIAIYALATSSVKSWRYQYCQNNPAHAIECTAKGWW